MDEILNRATEVGYKPTFYLKDIDTLNTGKEFWSNNDYTYPFLSYEDHEYLELCLMHKWLQDEIGYLIQITELDSSTQKLEINIIHSSKATTPATSDLYNKYSKALRAGVALILNRGDFN